MAARRQGQRADVAPFLRLGISAGFFSTYDPTAAEGDRITGMWLNGKAIDGDAVLGHGRTRSSPTGGDNFRGFSAGTSKRDTGKADLQAMVDYLATFAKTPLGVKLTSARWASACPPVPRASTGSARTSRSTCPRSP